MDGGPSMSSPLQISSNTAPSPLLRRRAKMMHTLPPVFSPEHSPPLGVSNRTAYLPLISPAPHEEGNAFDFSTRRRGSTPSLAKSSASQYFEELRKRRRTSENTYTASLNDSTKQPVFMDEKESQSTGRFAELPSSIAQSILRALEAQAKVSNITMGSAFLKKRTMSMPSASADEEFEMGRDDKRQRRASMRSQQLALLASQARLARTGATSVHTALRAERAVEGAVRQVVEEARVGASNQLLSKNSSDDLAEQQKKSGEISPTDVEEKQSAVVERHGAASAWSDALSTPHTATAFLSSASKVAHDWANGFYRFEEEWAEDALKKEKRRLSHVSGKRPRVDVLLEPEVAGDSEEGPPSPKKVASEPSTREASPVVDTAPDSSTGASLSVRSTLVAAHKRLSASLPTIPTTNSSNSNLSEGGGQLVDVLTNFASLIGQRKEVCHGLEKLAQDAKSLSSVPLPSVSSNFSKQISLEEEEDQDDYVYESTST